MNKTRITSAVATVAAVGGLVVGLAGAANAAPAHGAVPTGAHPVTGQTSHFTVTNYTGVPVRFITYNEDPATGGPNLGYVAEPGKSMGFDVDNWVLGGHQTEAVISTLHGGKTWHVNMRANATGSYIMCIANAPCSPNYLSQSTDVVLY